MVFKDLEQSEGGGPTPSRLFAFSAHHLQGLRANWASGRLKNTGDHM